MAKVFYRWSKKGKPDLCSYEEITTRGEHLCYHCGTKISGSSDAVLLQSDRGEAFFLHKICAEKSCSFIKEGCL